MNKKEVLEHMDRVHAEEIEPLDMHSTAREIAATVFWRIRDFIRDQP
jgi:hypothetical protein